MVSAKIYSGLFLSICSLPLLLTPVEASEFGSIQLVGRFGGITCEPGDPENDMDPAGPHLWQKLKYVSEPGDPDSISYKFTAENSYLPMHWGYDLIADYGYSGWGFADYSWSPPNIIAILEDPGYYYFHFNDQTYEYWLSRPDAAIEGIIDCDLSDGAPPGLILTLLDTELSPVGTIGSFADSSFIFDHLPEGIFSILASAPGYSDTTVTDIYTTAGDTVGITITLTSQVGVTISSAEARHVEGGILVTWATSSGVSLTGFNIFRGTTEEFCHMVKRNDSPIFALYRYSYLDICDDAAADYYYFIVEATAEDPFIYGPLKAASFHLPRASALGQNYPNPFNPSTTIPFNIAEGGFETAVSISFYDVSGKMIDRNDLGVLPAGNHVFEWNPRLSAGRNLPSGVYYCRLNVGKETFTRKMVLLR